MMESTRNERTRGQTETLGEAQADLELVGKPIVAVGGSGGPARSQGIRLEEVLEETNMRKALKRVQDNQGAPGVDGMKAEELSGYLERHGAQLHEELLQGRYLPKPVRRVEIPKGSGGTRQLGIPTVIDRMIQQALMQVLQESWDRTFSENSYGFRPGRSAHQAIAQAQRNIQSGLGWVVDIDLEKFFDRVNHDRLMAAIAARVEDKRLLRLIRRYLEAGAMSGGLEEATEEGVPQGGPLSPLLSNLVLDELDKELEKRGHAFVRYADDCNIYVASEKAGYRVMESVKDYLTRRMKLRVNEAKSAVDRPSRRKFLGYSFTPGKTVKRRVSPASAEKVKKTIREKSSRSGGRSLRQVITGLNEYLRGWYSYYGACESRTILRDLDGWLRRRLRALLWEQWKNNRKRVQKLLNRGADRDLVFLTIWQRNGAWRAGNSRVMNVTFDKEWFREQGLFHLFEAKPIAIV